MRANGRFLENFAVPCQMRTEIVTALLKCAPLTAPKQTIPVKNVSATDAAYPVETPLDAPQLTPMRKKA